MSEEDQEKTAFITNQGLYCYRVMPFSLKNARATYQRLVNQMFSRQIGQNMEVYVDHMLVKSRKAEQHLDDLKEAFDVLTKYQMRLNPAKCVFGVSSGKFLGFMVSQRDECEAAFQALKSYLSKPPLLSPSVEGEDLLLYLAVSETAVSSALIREEVQIQRPVYYTSQAFQGAEARYPKIEKLAFALIVASRKLRPYFQAHPILVMTDQPLRKAMSRPNAAGRMVQWVVELSQFDVDYRPRVAIKAQALADFVAEFTTAEQGPGSEHWTIHTDGSAALGIGGVGMILSSPKNDVIKYGVRLQFPATNNEAEYKAVLSGLRVVKAIGVKSLTLDSDSKLVTRQLKNEYEAKEDRMKRYMALANQLISDFDDVKIIQVPREENSEADEVARLASSDTSKRRPDLLLEVKYL
nr:uncharacterized protein LOC111984244 [Quercus suber]